MRAVLLLGLAAALLVCGSGSAAGTATTSLTVTYWPLGPGDGGKRTWSVACAPARGSLARPVRACRKLNAGGAKLFAPTNPTAACTQVYGGPEIARVVGKVKSVRVSTSVHRRDGCGISRWDRLSPWLLPPGGA